MFEGAGEVARGPFTKVQNAGRGVIPAETSKPSHRTGRLDRQRSGLHHPLLQQRSNLPQRPRERTRQTPSPPEELTPQPPATWGNVERFQQTLKRWLRNQPRAATIAELQAQLDTFADIYNHHRPHRSLPRRSTPVVAYQARPKATPGNDHPDTEFRVRHDRIQSGRVSLRINGQMHHIGLGRTLDGTRVIMLIDHHNIRVIHATTGEIIRTLTINPQRRYHGTGKPTGGPKGPRKIKRSGP